MRLLFPFIMLYGAINAIAYSSLLPMWEGFCRSGWALLF
jgi:hypothetical protein